MNRDEIIDAALFKCKSPADALAYVESVMAAKLGDLARELRASGPGQGLDKETIDGAIEFAIDEMMTAALPQLRAAVVKAFRRTE